VRTFLALLLLTSSLALAGCTQGDPGDDLPPTCPSWTKGLSSQVVQPGIKLLYSNQTMTPDFDDWDFGEEAYYSNGTLQSRWSAFGSNLETFMDYPLDFLVFDFEGAAISGGKSILYVQDAEVKLEFFAAGADGAPSGERLSAWDERLGRSSSRSEWVFRSDAATGYSQSNVTLRVELAPSDQEPNPRGVFVYWSWTFDLDRDRDTASLLYVGYSPEFWYRTCGSDGVRL
jgi:hypothetical protein